jgi:hypothetical protein
MFFLSLKGYVAGQRFSTGVVLSTSGYFNTELPENYIYSPNSYLIYYSANEKRDFRPSFGQTCNVWTGGLSFNIDYKRVMLGMELGGGIRSINIPALYPVPLNDVTDKSSVIPFTVLNSFSSVGLILTTRLNAQVNGPFLQLGMSTSFNVYREKYGDDLSPLINTNLSDNELVNTIYTEQFLHYHLITGLGWKLNNNYISLRNNVRFLGKQSDYPLARFFELNAVYTRLLTFQKLKRGYHLYLEQ